MNNLFTKHEVGKVMVVALLLPDTLDSTEFDRLNTALLELVDSHGHRRWVIDLSGSRYLGSAVLGLLVNLRQRIRAAQGTLVLCGLHAQLEEVFHATSLVRLFPIVRTRDEAVRVAAR